MPGEIEKFEKFLEETLRPDYLKAVEDGEKILAERHEYEILLVAVNKITESKCDKLNTRVNLGHHVFVNAEVDKCDTVIVKMMGDLFVELPLKRAVHFIEARIKLLDERALVSEKIASKIRAHIDVVLSSLDDYQKLEKTGK